jgi:hypothetical protein
LEECPFPHPCERAIVKAQLSPGFWSSGQGITRLHFISPLGISWGLALQHQPNLVSKILNGGFCELSFCMNNRLEK